MKITVFGEILWDIFGDERKIGGAPFNLAAHASKLGADVDFISAVGEDENGREALAECRRLGLDPANVAVIDKPTGYCMVTLKDGTPDYDLVMDTAYDNIPVPSETKDTDVFCFGTLAQRNGVSRRTLKKLLDLYRGKEIFLDVNIRQHYYTAEILDDSLKAATILKISREEAGVFGIPGTPEEICGELLDRYPGIKLIIMTLDSDGAFIFPRGGSIIYSSKPCCRVVSTVGAGDSFSAGFIICFMRGEPLDVCIEKAVKLSGFVCEHTGAIPEYDKDITVLFNI